MEATRGRRQPIPAKEFISEADSINRLCFFLCCVFIITFPLVKSICDGFFDQQRYQEKLKKILTSCWLKKPSPSKQTRSIWNITSRKQTVRTLPFYFDTLQRIICVILHQDDDKGII